MKTTTYYADVSQLDDFGLYSNCYRSMPDCRKKKIDGFLFPKDKKLSIGVELLARKAIRDFCNDPDSICLRYDDNGKPFLHGSNLSINISHSGIRALCSISDHVVGCDVETIQDIDMSIAKNYFYGSEYDTIQSSDPSMRNEMFFRYWTLKESFMKATGLGMSLPLDSFRIDLTEPITVMQNVDSNKYYFKEYNENDGYRYAVCSTSDEFETRMRLVDIGESL